MISLTDTLVAIAVRILPDDRQEWGHAMHAELDAAREGGRPLAFAIDCLLGSLRAHLDRPEGRMVATRLAVALATLVPLATFHLGCAFACFGFALGRPDHFHAALAAGDVGQRSIAAAYAAAAPLIGILLLALTGAHLLAAWHIMDWSPRPMLRAVAAGLLAAAGLAIVILSVMGESSGVAIQFAGSGIEMAMLAIFALWTHRLAETSDDRPQEEEWT